MRWVAPLSFLVLLGCSQADGEGTILPTDAGTDAGPDAQGPCEPTTCSALGKNCGQLDDGCGGVLSCGTCEEPTTCGGGGTANMCGLPRLEVSDNGRFLVSDGRPFFLMSDTAWTLSMRVDRAGVATYLDHRASVGFNSIGIVAFPWPGLDRPGSDPPEPQQENTYGDRPFALVDGVFDSTQPITTPGSDPDDSVAYDYWDHLDYVLDEAAARGLYVIMAPVFGQFVAGSWDGQANDDVIFDESNARTYGRWIGERYGDRTHLMWMLGGDRSAVYGPAYGDDEPVRDYRTVFRAMAAGIEETAGTEILMSYWPRKGRPNSSEWFHNDGWLDFDSIQDAPEDQSAAVARDWGLVPAKPTWLLEGRYEDCQQAGATYGPWQVRFQAYQTVFGGAFGHQYGHYLIMPFRPAQWEPELDDAGALQMQYLVALMSSLSDVQYLERIPDQQLIIGNTGEVAASSPQNSDRLQATRDVDGTYALIYSANGRDIHVDASRLAAGSASAHWFNPRSGNWWVAGQEFAVRTAFATGIPCGPGAQELTASPPGTVGADNDWVLLLTVELLSGQADSTGAATAIEWR